MGGASVRKKHSTVMLRDSQGCSCVETGRRRSGIKITKVQNDSDSHLLEIVLHVFRLPEPQHVSSCLHRPPGYSSPAVIKEELLSSHICGQKKPNVAILLSCKQTGPQTLLLGSNSTNLLLGMDQSFTPTKQKTLARLFV